jgi:hypothetical protein
MKVWIILPYTGFGVTFLLYWLPTLQIYISKPRAHNIHNVNYKELETRKQAKTGELWHNFVRKSLSTTDLIWSISVLIRELLRWGNSFTTYLLDFTEFKQMEGGVMGWTFCEKGRTSEDNIEAKWNRGHKPSSLLWKIAQRREARKVVWRGMWSHNHGPRRVSTYSENAIPDANSSWDMRSSLFCLGTYCHVLVTRHEVLIANLIYLTLITGNYR